LNENEIQKSVKLIADLTEVCDLFEPEFLVKVERVLVLPIHTAIHHVFPHLLGAKNQIPNESATDPTSSP
jgi:hypothetical protein